MTLDEEATIVVGDGAFPLSVVCSRPRSSGALKLAQAQRIGLSSVSDKDIQIVWMDFRVRVSEAHDRSR